MTRQKTIKTPKHPRKIEAEYYKKIRSIFNQITNDYEESITIGKFTDSRTSDIKDFDKSVKKTLSKVSPMVDTMTAKLYKYYNRTMARNIRNGGFDIDLKRYFKSDKETIKLLGENTEEYIIKNGQDYATWLKTTTRQNFIEGGTASNLEEEIKSRLKTNDNKAKLIARNETGTFVGSMNVKRGQDLGIEYGIWKTVGDGRVRESHQAVDGVKFKLSEGLLIDGEYTFPSIPIRCRCQLFFVVD